MCGQVYEACHTPNLTGAFRWQDVACCKEHGAQYLKEIMASRGLGATPPQENIDNGAQENNED